MCEITVLPKHNQALQVSVSHVQCNPLKVIRSNDLKNDLALHTQTWAQHLAAT